MGCQQLNPFLIQVRGHCMDSNKPQLGVTPVSFVSIFNAISIYLYKYTYK